MILGIYGAGGLGLEVYELALVINSSHKRWDNIIFVDDSKKTNENHEQSIHKFDDLNRKFNLDSLEMCIAIGEPTVRKILFDKLRSNKITIATLIHPDVGIAKSTQIGIGCIINKYVSITSNIILKENVYVHPMACIGHHAIIGSNSIISSFVAISGNCSVGNCTFLAINVILKQGIKVGDNTIVGLASVVHRDIGEGVIALGNPARPMKKNENNRVFG